MPVARLLPFVHANKSVRETLVALHEQGIKIGKTKLHELMKPLRAKWCAAANLKVRPPKKLTQRDQRRICKLVRVDRLRRKTHIFRGLRSLGYDSSYQTVRRELDRMPTIMFSRPAKKPFITDAHKRARLAWAREQLASPTDWTKVFFLDEKQWMVDGPRCTGKVLWDIRDAKPTQCSKGTRNASVEVWGAFSLTAVPPLSVISKHFNSDQYISILAARFLPYARSPVPVLLHDRHPAHRSKRTMHWLTLLGIEVIVLPPKSPDLNPIENIWSVISSQVYDGLKTYNSKDALLEAVKSALSDHLSP